MRNLFCLVVFSALMSCSFSKEKRGNIKLSNLKFESIFGYNSKDSLRVYCLLGTGFFRAPSSSNSDSLINIWINKHPNASVIPISTLNEPDSKLTYCWLIDNGDTINNYLIKNGCFPGGTMMYPESSTNNTEIQIHIDRQGYKTFIEQIKYAEIIAKKNKLGIWHSSE